MGTNDESSSRTEEGSTPNDPTLTENAELHPALKELRNGGLLTVIAGPDEGAKVDVKGDETLVGRAASSDLQLSDAGVSKKHCRIFTSDAFYVEDLASKNGTLLNGRRIDWPRKLSPGDAVAIGRQTLLQFSTLGHDNEDFGKPGQADLELVVGEESNWFRVNAGSPVDLRRRGSLRRILERLVKDAAAEEKRARGVHELFDIGWDGERIDPDLAADRVYWAIRTLRDEGLRGVLVTSDDGYFLATGLVDLRRHREQIVPPEV